MLNDLFDLAERCSGLVGEPRTFLHLARPFFHDGHGLAGLDLDALDQARNVLRRPARAFRQLSHFVGNNGEAFALLTGPRSFNGGIQRQHVRLGGDLVDHFNDGADLKRPFAETFYLFCR